MSLNKETETLMSILDRNVIYVYQLFVSDRNT